MKKFVFILLFVFIASCASREPITDKKINLAKELVEIQFPVEDMWFLIDQYSVFIAPKDLCIIL